MAMTLEQQRALTMARVRLRKQQNIDQTKAEARERLAAIEERQNESNGIVGTIADKAGGAAGAFTRYAVPFSDEIAAGMGAPVLSAIKRQSLGDSYNQLANEARSMREDFAEDHTNVSRALNVAGGVAGAVGGARAGLRAPAGSVARTVLAPSTAGGAAASGATLGAAFGAGEADGGDVGDRLLAAVQGGALGAATGFVGGKVLDKLFPNAQRLTGANLEAAEKAAYQAAEESGTLIRGSSLVQKIGRGVRDNMTLDPVAHPKAVYAKQILDDLADSNVSIGQLQDRRAVLNELVESTKDATTGTVSADGLRILDIIRSLDDSVGQLGIDDLAAGGREGIDMLTAARGLSRQKFKNQTIERAFERARNHPKGSSFEVTLKNEFRNIANKPKMMRSFSKAEQEAILKTARTGVLEKTLHNLAVLAPTSGRLGMTTNALLGSGAGAATVAGASVSPGLLAVPAAGLVADAGSRGIVRGNANIARQLVEQGSLQPFAARAANAPIARALTRGGTN